MQDDKIESRKNKFQKVSFDLLETREKFKLSLRKEKLEDIFNSKRKIKVNPHVELEIDPSTLSLSEEHLKITDLNLEGEVALIKELLFSSKLNEVKFGIYRARRLLCSENTTNINFILSKGMLSQFLEILENSKDNLILYETLWCLIQLSSTNMNMYSKLMISPKAQEAYEFLLTHERSELIEMTLNLISNFVIENFEIKIEILKSKLFKSIVKLIDQENNPIGVSRNLAFLVSNIVNQKKPYLTEEIIKFCQDLLMKLILVQDRKVILDSIWGLCYTTDTDYDNITRNIFDTGIIHKLLKLDFSELNEFKIPTIRMIGNVVSLDNSITEEMIKLGVINKVEVLLNDKNKQIVREATWIISNITAGTKSQIDYILKNQNIYNKLVSLTKDNDYSIKMEAINALSFACSGSDFNLCLILINMKIFELFIELLGTNTEPKLILTILEGIENILTQGEIMKQINQINPYSKKFDDLGGVNQINRLQKFKNEVIYNTSIKILEKYFSHLIVND